MYLSAQLPTEPQNQTQTYHRTIKIAGTEIFYREAGPSDAPALLLVHDFPTSSQMFRELIPRLAGKYRVIAPDYPGFGNSAMPDRVTFACTFAHLAEIVDQFTEAVGLKTYGPYLMDYGAPIGYRLALAHPERVTALIVQNGNAYEEGLGDFWIPFKKFWLDPSEENKDALRPLLQIGATKWQYTNGVADTSLVNPDTWNLDQQGLDRPGNDQIQLDLFYDYRTNLPFYPRFQEFFRKYQPPTLIVWGKNDAIFLAEGAAPYKRDLPQVELHLLDTGHFALETHGQEIAAKILDFLHRQGKR